MNLMQTIQKKGRRLVKGVQGIITPDKAIQRLNELKADVELGKQVEGFLQLPIWTTHIEPWINGRLSELSTKLHHGRRTHPQDERGYYEVGGFENLSDLVGELKRLINQKTKALQELETLKSQIEEESRDGRKGSQSGEPTRPR